MTDQRTHQVRRNQADETNGAGHGDRATDAERDAYDHQEPQPADIDAKALRSLLAEAERAEGVARAKQDHRSRHDERQRQHDMTKAAILKRAEQPERDFK